MGFACAVRLQTAAQEHQTGLEGQKGLSRYQVCAVKSQGCSHLLDLKRLSYLLAVRAAAECQDG